MTDNCQHDVIQTMAVSSSLTSQFSEVMTG